MWAILLSKVSTQIYKDKIEYIDIEIGYKHLHRDQQQVIRHRKVS